MTTIPAPTTESHREEWPDADFDIPEGQPLHSMSDKDDEEDWDIEMDLGKTGGAKVIPMSSRVISSDLVSQMVTIRPPQKPQIPEDDEDDDEGVSTIKAGATVVPRPKPKIDLQDPIDEDFEDGLALPSDLTRLSLAPLSLNHRSSKNSLEWGDKDQTSSSQSSDAYSTLGFADASPSSNSTSSASLPDTEESEEDEEDMEGVVIPSEIFESGHGGRQLNKILELKKAMLISHDNVKVASPDPEDDFEMGLVIDDDVDFSPSRLLHSAQQQKAQRTGDQRSHSLPTQRPTSLRPPSRLKSDRAKSPANPPPASARQLQKLRLSPSPPLHPPTRSQTFQPLSQASSSTFLAPKSGSLRGQKSHSGLKPPTPPPTRKLTRKASLSSLMDKGSSQASGSGSGSTVAKARYEEPTAASRAKSQRYKVPPTRPSTPSSNPAALRLTMPISSSSRTRPALSSVWGAPASPAVPSPTFRNTSSPLPRPPSSLSTKASRSNVVTSPSAPRVLRKPRRARQYGDGTELDGIEDLPTDRDKESRFRVQPKGYGNRIPGGTYSSKTTSDKGTVRRKRREPSGSSSDVLGSSTRKSSRVDLSALKSSFDRSPKKKKTASSPSQASRKKPTLIRNLGGTGAPKVVGDMKWNPQTLRWEGNEHILRDFDAVVTSTRPALITHLTGSSIGSPVGSFASGARIVGNMIFDPQRMCWISTLPPEEDEPDVFANLADDEEEGDGWESKGGTIRGGIKSLTPSETSRTSTSMSGMLVDPPSPSRSSRTRSPSVSDDDRGSRASIHYDIDANFVDSCRAAEQRHHAEISSWKDILARQGPYNDPERADLYEIRALATRKY
ncbi:two-component gap byr4 [Moniliophthora roreri MCA 2997]|uniref:Two-component gap byr4 n=2 Tax=Moniliophthora roreri TaxID=221103 RepID=V2Z1W4_MONRO|nr:two-component gap byr4 [Moniliophthora roreri MCA 2997]KAI3622321.1 two-component gap byr4 [Moniliophthora roreri]